MTAMVASPSELLAWYDRHARDLPWRVRPQARALNGRQDPYRVWLSEIMLQQTTVAAVKPYYAAFLARWPTVVALAAANEEDILKAWAGLGYYSRARNLAACARAIVDRHGGQFPDSEAALRALPGIGAYTAAAIAAIAFDRPAVVVDGNVERVITRLHAIETPLPAARPVIQRHAAALTPTDRPGDFAQAMMDLGATLCTPKSPACGLCPWRTPCQARAAGTATSYPRKAPKAERPVRRGDAFVCRRADGAILLRRRPPEGLLGGMTEVPTTDWTTPKRGRPAADPGRYGAPFEADWVTLNQPVEHTFTHFHLILRVKWAEFSQSFQAPEGFWWSGADAHASEALPSVMRKVIAALPPQAKREPNTAKRLDGLGSSGSR